MVLTRLEKETGEFTVILPPVISTTEMVQISAVLAQAKADSGVKQVLITGGEEGADMEEIAALLSHGSEKEKKDAAYEYASRGQELIIAIRDFPKRVVALVIGDCFNGGLEIALGCHHVIAARTARFGFLEYIQFGLMPFWGGSYFFVVRLAEKMRKFAEETDLREMLAMTSADFRTVASSYLYTFLTQGKVFSAQEMLQLRLVDKVTEIAEERRQRPDPTGSPPSTAVRVETILFNQKNRKDQTNGDVLDEEDVLQELAKIFSDFCIFPEIQERIMGSR